MRKNRSSIFHERADATTGELAPVVQFVDRECAKHWLTEAEIKLLKQVSHPDKHDNSAASVRAFELLDKYPARRV